MSNNSQTDREKTKKSSSTASESLSAPTNNDITAMMIIDRKISLATEGLQPCFENWLRIRTSNENALTISEYVFHEQLYAPGYSWTRKAKRGSNMTDSIHPCITAQYML